MKSRSHALCLLLIPVGIAALLFGFSYAVYALWNGVLVDVLGVKALSFWQALGILVLAKILFGGFPCHSRGWGGGFRARMMAKRWEKMTPEQREYFREEMRRRCGDMECGDPCSCDHKTKADEPKG